MSLFSSSDVPRETSTLLSGESQLADVWENLRMRFTWNQRAGRLIMKFHPPLVGVVPRETHQIWGRRRFQLSHRSPLQAPGLEKKEIFLTLPYPLPKISFFLRFT